MSRRTPARLAALPAAAGIVTVLAAAPASAHVTVTPSEAGAGSFTVLTVALSHGCDGSPTTALDVQIPEEVLSVSATRSAFWTAEPQIETLDEPVTDSHGNEVTERVASVRFEATEPLPDGVRDAVELSFQVPDAVGETLSFPTIQECEEGETAWTQVPEEGQSGDELDTPAPGFVVTEATGDGHDSTTADAAADSTEAAATTGDAGGSDTLGIAALVAGLLGLVAGVTALARSRSRA